MNLLSSLEQVTVVSTKRMSFFDCIHDEILDDTNSSQNTFTHNTISLSINNDVFQCLHPNLILSFNITF